MCELERWRRCVGENARPGEVGKCRVMIVGCIGGALQVLLENHIDIHPSYGPP